MIINRINDNREGKMLFTLKNGEQKWMTKREYKNYIKHLESIKSIYNEYVEYGDIDPKLSQIEQVHQVVDLGVNLMSIIGNTADSITISGYNRIKNEVNEKISKADFVDIVKYVSTHLDEDNNGDDEKLTKKLLKDINATIYKINLKRIFYTKFNSEKDFIVPEDSCEVIFPKLKEMNNKRFKEIVKSCAKARKYLDQTLWPQYQDYASLVEYITKGEISYKEYKKLVDYKYYTGDEDKRFQNQDKRWEKLVENFLYAYKLCKKYGYNDYFREVEDTIYNYTHENYEYKEMA